MLNQTGVGLLQLLRQLVDGLVYHGIGMCFIHAFAQQALGRGQRDFNGLSADFIKRAGLGLGDFFRGQDFEPLECVAQALFRMFGHAIGFVLSLSQQPFSFLGRIALLALVGSKGGLGLFA